MKTQFGKLIRESEICVLCAKRKATTKEHIPPQGLFVTLPGEYLAVPACKECNDSTKLDDEYLRQVMSASSHSKSGIEVWREKVAPKLPLHPKTRAGLRNRLSVDKLNVQPFGEVSLPTLRIDRNRAGTSLRKLVAGLYWFHTGEMLEPGIQLDIFFLNVAELAEHFADAEKMAIFKKTTTLGLYRDPEVMKTFFYFGAISETNSLWYFFFYKQNAFVVIAAEPEQF